MKLTRLSNFKKYKIKISSQVYNYEYFDKNIFTQEFFFLII